MSSQRTFPRETNIRNDSQKQQNIYIVRIMVTRLCVIKIRTNAFYIVTSKVT